MKKVVKKQSEIKLIDNEIKLINNRIKSEISYDFIKENGTNVVKFNTFTPLVETINNLSSYTWSTATNFASAKIWHNGIKWVGYFS